MNMFNVQYPTMLYNTMQTITMSWSSADHQTLSHKSFIACFLLLLSRARSVVSALLEDPVFPIQVKFSSTCMS